MTPPALWWALRLRFQATYRAVVGKLPYAIDEIISIDPKLPELLPLTMELSQPTYSINTVGKIVIDKSPDGTRSPNLADAVMICFQPATRTLETWIALGRAG
jgi:phage terminase large subunit